MPTDAVAVVSLIVDKQLFAADCQPSTQATESTNQATPMQSSRKHQHYYKKTRTRIKASNKMTDRSGTTTRTTMEDGAAAAAVATATTTTTDEGGCWRRKKLVVFVLSYLINSVKIKQFRTTFACPSLRTVGGVNAAVLVATGSARGWLSTCARARWKWRVKCHTRHVSNTTCLPNAVPRIYPTLSLSPQLHQLQALINYMPPHQLQDLETRPCSH
jgi:hypothetical protein